MKKFKERGRKKETEDWENGQREKDRIKWEKREAKRE